VLGKDLLENDMDDEKNVDDGVGEEPNPTCSNLSL